MPRRGAARSRCGRSRRPGAAPRARARWAWHSGAQYPVGMHPSAMKVTGVLRELGVTGDVRELPEAAPTAATAAAQLGCEVGAIANSLVFNADGTPLLVLTSGAHRVDTGRVAALSGADKVRRADPDFVRRSTGQVIGGVAPVGHPAPLRTLVDTWLESYPVV